MNNKSTIVYFDIDGTLFDSHRGIKVPVSTVEAIRSLKRRGILTALNTGRSAGMIPTDIIALGFDAIVAGGGTFVSYGGNIILNEIFDEARTEKVLRAFRAERLDVLFEGPVYAYFEEESFDADIVARSAHMFDDLNTLRSLTDAKPEINKVSYLIFDQEKDRRLRELLKDELNFIVYPHALREGMPHGFSKGSAMEFLEDTLGGSFMSYAIGDSVNDLTMFSRADIAIVMGNGQDEVKECATLVTGAVEEDGIWHALRHFQLID